MVVSHVYHVPLGVKRPFPGSLGFRGCGVPSSVPIAEKKKKSWGKNKNQKQREIAERAIEPLRPTKKNVPKT